MTPYFERIKDCWIGTIQTQTKVEEVCDKVIQSRTLVLEPGVNRIPIREGCQILGETFSLPKFTVHGTTVRNVTVINAPYNVSPVHHLDIPYLEYQKLNFVKPMKEQSLKFLAYTAVMRSHKLRWHATVNTTAVIIVFCLFVFLILFIKCRHACYDLICNRPTSRRQRLPYTPPAPRPTPSNSPLISPTQLINRLSAIRLNQSPSRPAQATPAPNKPIRTPITQLNIPMPSRAPPQPPVDGEPEYLEMKVLI